MPESEFSSAWFKMMCERLGTDEEGVREYMRENQRKSMQNPNRQKGNHRGGFNNSPEFAKLMSKKAVEAKRRKRTEASNPVADLDNPV